MVVLLAAFQENSIGQKGSWSIINDGVSMVIGSIIVATQRVGIDMSVSKIAHG